MEEPVSLPNKKKKLSKSELSTPEFAERARVATLEIAAKQETYNKKWAVGEAVWHQGKRGIIVSFMIGQISGWNRLTLKFPDDTVVVVKPYALNRKDHSHGR